MRNIAMTFAELEREMTAERTRDKMIAIAKQGRWPGGVPPYGYNVRNSELVPDEHEAPIVRLIYEAYLRTRSLAAIRDKLVALGIKPSNWSTKTNPDRPALRYWSKQKLSYILQNRIYLGELNYSGLRCEGSHPALIDPETF